MDLFEPRTTKWKLIVSILGLAYSIANVSSYVRDIKDVSEDIKKDKQLLLPEKNSVEED